MRKAIKYFSGLQAVLWILFVQGIWLYAVKARGLIYPKPLWQNILRVMLPVAVFFAEYWLLRIPKKTISKWTTRIVCCVLSLLVCGYGVLVLCEQPLRSETTNPNHFLALDRDIALEESIRQVFPVDLSQATESRYRYYHNTFLVGFMAEDMIGWRLGALATYTPQTYENEVNRMMQTGLLTDTASMIEGFTAYAITDIPPDRAVTAYVLLNASNHQILYYCQYWDMTKPTESDFLQSLLQS